MNESPETKAGNTKCGCSKELSGSLMLLSDWPNRDGMKIATKELKLLNVSERPRMDESDLATP